MLSQSGCRAANAAFFYVAFGAVPFLLMVFIMFANKKRRRWRNRDIPLTCLWCTTRLAAGIGVVTWEPVRMAFLQVQAGCGLRPGVCDGRPAAGTMCTKEILDDTPCCAAKLEDYMGQSASCFVGKPTNRLGAAARQDLLEADSASHHFLSATPLHPMLFSF